MFPCSATKKSTLIPKSDDDDDDNKVKTVSMEPPQFQYIDVTNDEIEIVAEIPAHVPPKSSLEQGTDTSDDVKVIAVEGVKLDNIEGKNIEIVAVHPASIQMFQQLQPTAQANSPPSATDTESADELSKLEQNQLMNTEACDLYDGIWYGECWNEILSLFFFVVVHV